MKTIASKEQRIVLASQSPRRIELLGFLKLKFEIIPSAVVETIDPALSPSDLVVTLAKQKAFAVAEKLISQDGGLKGQQLVLIGADTIVVCQGRTLGKPNSEQDAVEMLSFLSGKVHQVYTGITILSYDHVLAVFNQLSESEVSTVRFRKLERYEILAYVQTKEPMDKAGSYALQGTGAAFVEGIEGCYTNVIGLPIPRVVSMLRRVGVEILGLRSPVTY